MHWLLKTPCFNRSCRALALGGLLAATIASLLLQPIEGDFAQYYMAGTIARERAWDALYPIPRPGSLHNPGLPWDSKMRRRYAQLARETGVGENQMRFVQPPPAALIYWPLAYLSYPTAGRVWIVLLALCAWGAAVQAGMILEVLLGCPSRCAGILTLIIAASPRLVGAIRWGNVSPIMALLLGLTVLGLLRRRNAAVGVSLLLGAIAKYALAVLLPLLVAMRRWRAILWTSALGVATLALSLAIMGTGPFLHFVREIAPTLKRPYLFEGEQSLYRLLFALNGLEPLPASWVQAVIVVQALSLAATLWLIFRQPQEDWRQPPRVLAAAASLVAWFMIFSPIYWHHYYVYLFPFWGWMAWEMLQSRRRAVLSAFSMLLAWVTWAQLPDFGWQLPYLLHFYLLLSTILTLLLAIMRLTAQQIVPEARFEAIASRGAA